MNESGCAWIAVERLATVAFALQSDDVTQSQYAQIEPFGQRYETPSQLERLMLNQPNAVDIVPIDDVIHQLANAEPAPENLLRQELIIRLGMWMQFSSEPSALSTAIFAGALQYIKGKCDNKAPEFWDNSLKELLLRTIPFDRLCDSSEAIILPWFESELKSYSSGPEYHNIKVVEDLEVITETAQILLWYKPIGHLKGDRASLKRIYNVLTRRTMRIGKYFETDRTFLRALQRPRAE